MDSENKPDIMLLVIDSLRADHLGCYGYERETSPFIDKLAADGVKFENCYANSYWSVPSHASIFTGDLVSEHKVFSKKDPKLKAENTLIKYLNDSGYFTYGNSNNMWVNDLYGYDKEFEKFDFQLLSSDMGDEESNEMLKNLQRGDWDSRKEKYLEALEKASRKGPKTLLKLASFKFERKFGKKWGLADYGAKKSIRRIKENGKKSNKPFFAFCNFMEVHTSYAPPLGFKRKFSSYHWPKNGVVDSSKKVSEKDLQKRINLYDDCIRYIDSKLEDFIEEYKQENPETVFIITSDHGELFFDNSLKHEESKQGHNTSCSDELLKVPLILYSEETDLEELFDQNEVVSLRKIKDIIESIIEGKKFSSEGFTISENIEKDQVSSKIATDGENKAIVSEKGEYLIGNKTSAKNLMEKLKTRTEKIQKMESLTNEKDIIEAIDI